MDRVYLQEAFHAMELLEEEAFGIDDAGVKDILDFQDHDELNDIVDVVDPEAETEEDVKDSYIGDVVLECTVCHSPIFKAVEDVVVDEESGEFANLEDECPICHSNDGFKVIGVIAPFEEDPELKVEIEDKECEDGECEEEDVELDDEDIEDLEDELDDEDVKESLDEKFVSWSKPTVFIDASGSMQFNDKSASKVKHIVDSLKKYFDDDINVLYFGETVSENPHKVGQSNEEGMLLDYMQTNNVMFPIVVSDEDFEHEIKDLQNVEFEFVNINNPGALQEIAKKLEARLGKYDTNESLKEELDPELEDKLDDLAATVEETAMNIDHLTNVVEDAVEEVCPECEDTEDDEEIPEEEAAEDEAEEVADEEVPEEVEESLTEEKCEICGKDVKEPCKKCKKQEDEKEDKVEESLREGFEKVDLEMEDKIIHVSEEEKEPIPDAEMIAPVSDELESEIMAPVEEPTEEPADAPVEDMPIEETPLDDAEGEEFEGDAFEEEPAEDEFDGQESLKENTDKAVEIMNEEINYEVEDFEESTFDKLGEAYLKNVYENVESFATSNVKLTEDDKLVVEGVIKFNSGKEKETKFIFESKDATKDGVVRFIGENAQITRGKKAFTLTGNISEGKFIAESLNYNYRADSNRIYGTVKING